MWNAWVIIEFTKIGRTVPVMGSSPWPGYKVVSVLNLDL